MSSALGLFRFRSRGVANAPAAVFVSLLIASTMSAGQPVDGRVLGKAALSPLSPMSATAVNGMELGGPFSVTYSPSADYDLKAGSICNHGSQAFSAQLRIELWAFPQPYTGGAVTGGYRLSNANVLSGLAQNQCYSNYDSLTAYPSTTPPSGTYHPVLFLSEYENASSNDGFVYDDYALVPSTVSVSNGVITVGAAPTGCTSDSQTLCIDDLPGDQRFQIRATFQTAQGTGQSGIAHPIGLSTLGVNQGGLLWFFSANNPEVVIKVVNGCTLNSRYWIFASAGTNVGVNMTVTDTKTSAVKTYTNPDLQAWAPIQDTGAFPCQ